MITALTLTAWLQIQCMAEAQFFEARNTTPLEQVAVLYVIKNRVDNPAFLDDACSVVHRPRRFEYYWDGKPETIPDEERYAYGPAIVRAAIVYYGLTQDPTQGATDYHDHTVSPGWPYEVVLRTSYFVFYRR